MQNSAANSKSQRQDQNQRQDRAQDKGPKFEPFFYSAMIGLDRRSKATGRYCDQKR